MIAAARIAALEERGLDYVLGARERGEALVRKLMLENGHPFRPLCVPRSGGAETQLMVAAGRCTLVCRNAVEAEKERADRAAVVDALDRQAKKGDKALIGNSAYRRYLRETSASGAFEIDPGKLADVLARISDHNIQDLDQLPLWNWKPARARLAA